MLGVLLALHLEVETEVEILKLEANLALDRPPGNKHSCQSKRRPNQE
jgi:hypothetical protein